MVSMHIAQVLEQMKRKHRGKFKASSDVNLAELEWMTGVSRGSFDRSGGMVFCKASCSK